MQQPIIATVEETFTQAKRIYNRDFEPVRVVFDIRRTSGVAGQATVFPRKIRINKLLLKFYPDFFKSVLVPHEVAHVVAFDLYGAEGWNHGPRWKSVMRSFGLAPDVRHDLVTEKNINIPVYECQRCSTQILVHRTSHALISNGISKCRPCRCNGSLTFMGTVYDLVKEKKLTCLKQPETI
jgi:SprT protein